MRLYSALSAAVILTLSLMASVASAQCQNCCGGSCNRMCGTTCLDGLVCPNPENPVQCSGNEPYCITTPIVIDTQNQGFHLTNMQGGVRFTFDRDLLQTSWTDQHYSNAWLVLDRNHNGTIDDASELFGELTPQPDNDHPNGFKALAVFDDPRNGGNGNGRIDPGDAVWSSLRLWVDRNHNGISEPSELIPLSEAGIFAIGLDYALSERVDEFGNQFRYVASVQDKYGNKNPLCYDVLLVTAAPAPGLNSETQNAGTTQR